MQKMEGETATQEHNQFHDNSSKSTDNKQNVHFQAKRAETEAKEKLKAKAAVV